MFMANYADVLTDAPLPDMIERFDASNAVDSLWPSHTSPPTTPWISATTV